MNKLSESQMNILTAVANGTTVFNGTRAATIRSLAKMGLVTFKVQSRRILLTGPQGWDRGRKDFVVTLTDEGAKATS